MAQPRPAADPGAAGIPDPATLAAAIGVALDAYAALTELAETVEDEWPYVTALAEAGRARIHAVAIVPPQETSTLAPDRARAVRLAAVEIRSISDPHRAIDWLSTFPAIVELALAPDRGA